VHAAGASVALTKPVTFTAFDNALNSMGLRKEQITHPAASGDVLQSARTSLVCPICGGVLVYQHSYLNSEAAQSDIFSCQYCCRQFARNRLTCELRRAG
jgi:hypothetical protein